MDETTYRISHEEQEICVNFDLREDENCFIELSFSKDDVLNIINMGTFRKEKIDLKSIEGSASLPLKNSPDRNIGFSYRSKDLVDSGTVFYSYDKLSVLLNEAFTKLNSDQPDD